MTDEEGSTNWILMSCQAHRVTSGQSKSSHKQIHISKLFSIYKTNHFANIKHTYTYIRQKKLKMKKDGFINIMNLQHTKILH